MWEYLAKVQIPKLKQVRIGPKTIDCVFIHYAMNSNKYRILVHTSGILDIHKSTIIESRNVAFFKDIFPCKKKETRSRKRAYDDAHEDNDNL